MILVDSFDPGSASSWGEWLIKLSLLFFIGGLCGWIIELFFRRIVHKNWVNPGFLVGPLLPLYGFGNATMYVLCSIPYDWVGPVWAQHIVSILFIGVLMTLIEFIAGLIFIKGMKIKLWDYSNMWGNVMGIICPLFSLIWLAVGAGYMYLLYEPFSSLMSFAVSNLLPINFLLGFLYGLLTTDLLYSFHVANRIKKFIEDKNLVIEWENMKTSFREAQAKRKAKKHYVLPFSGENVDFKSSVDNYVSELKNRLAEAKAKREAKKVEKQAKKNKE